MAKPKITWELSSWGIYRNWDRDSRELPEIVKFSEKIPARLGIEFGYILHLKKAKGKKIAFTIEHPPFPDDSGEVAPPFTGEVYVRSNNWEFFLGDTIWEPVHDKIGTWRLTVKLDGKIIADKSFSIVPDDEFPEF